MFAQAQPREVRFGRESRQIQALLWDWPRNENIAQIAEFHRPRGLVWC